MVLFPVHQIIGVEAESSEMVRRDSFLNLGAKCGVNTLKRPEMGVLIITHYQRILHLVEPDFVHVLYDGRIVKEGGPELVELLEQRGYGWIRDEVEAAA